MEVVHGSKCEDLHDTLHVSIYSGLSVGSRVRTEKTHFGAELSHRPPVC